MSLISKFRSRRLDKMNSSSQTMDDITTNGNSGNNDDISIPHLHAQLRCLKKDYFVQLFNSKNNEQKNIQIDSYNHSSSSSLLSSTPLKLRNTLTKYPPQTATLISLPQSFDIIDIEGNQNCDIFDNKNKKSEKNEKNNKNNSNISNNILNNTIMNPLNVLTHITSTNHYHIVHNINQSSTDNHTTTTTTTTTNLSNLSKCNLFNNLPNFTNFSSQNENNQNNYDKNTNFSNSHNNSGPLCSLDPFGFALFHNILNYLASSACDVQCEFDQLIQSLLQLSPQLILNKINNNNYYYYNSTQNNNSKNDDNSNTDCNVNYGVERRNELVWVALDNQ
jgi:hypothetical protein